MPHRAVNRRQIIRGLLTTGAAVASSRLWTGCTPASQNGPTAKKELVMGFIYVGSKDDFGYNQSHFWGKENLRKSTKLKIVDQANVAETTDVQKLMLKMIQQDRVNVLYPTSYGYFDPYILKLAVEYPEVQFFHCGGVYQEGKHPPNVGTYYGYIHETQYVAGVVAAHMTKTGKLGFVAAKPIPVVLLNLNSFTLGARSVDPTITTQVIFTGDWALPVKEAQATNSMADQGIDVVSCHVDSPKVVISTAEKRGMFSCGYHTDLFSLAPKGYLTGAEWDWTSVYANYTNLIQSGKTLMNGGIPHQFRGGMRDGFVKLSPYGRAATPEARQAAAIAKANLLDGSLIIYQGELKDNRGNVVIPAGKSFGQKAIELESMDWLVEGVIGKLS
jgi:basic membrane protein A and related proteins